MYKIVTYKMSCLYTEDEILNELSYVALQQPLATNSTRQTENIIIPLCLDDTEGPWAIHGREG